MVSIVIPVFNQLHHTTACLKSLLEAPQGIAEIIVVDNGSTDGTAAYLDSLKGVRVLRNPVNLGVAPAWNQGVRAAKAAWVLLLNNDVALPQGWLEGLLDFARERKVDVASPAIREGELDYDLPAYAAGFTRRMRRCIRPGAADGICFLVERRVFDQVGPFDEGFRIAQYEDADFFRRARRAGFRLATTGRSLIHHFGSSTQRSQRERGAVPPWVAENRAYFRRKWGLSFPRRRAEKAAGAVRRAFWKARELLAGGHTLKESWSGGRPRRG